MSSLVSIAIGFEALLLHGETRPFDVSSSQSNQRDFMHEERPAMGRINCRGPRWERRIAVSGQAPNLLGELACDAALDSTKRKTSVAQIVQKWICRVIQRRDEQKEAKVWAVSFADTARWKRWIAKD